MGNFGGLHSEFGVILPEEQSPTKFLLPNSYFYISHSYFRILSASAELNVKIICENDTEVSLWV